MKTNDKRSKLKRQAEYAGDGNVLDIGFSANPNPFLANAVGVDIRLPAETPSNYREVAVCNLNEQSLPFADNRFDAVIAGDVIEHLENPSQFLRETHRVLKMNGRLVISTPQANDWWITMHNWFLRRWIRDPDQGEHLQNWTLLDMTRLLKKNGFTVDAVEGFVLRFPYLTLQIPVRRFPILSWQVFYVARKTHEPDRRVLVHIDGAWQSV